MARRLLPVLPLLLVASPALAAESGGATSVVVGMAALVLVSGVLIALRRGPGMVVAAVGGALVAAYLAQHHAAAASGASSICNISSSWNCDVVNTSRYSEVFGKPIALLGFAFYVAMAWLGIRRNQGDLAPSVLVAAGAGLALLYDSFLAYQMVRLQTGCVLCITTYALNAVLFAGAIADLRGEAGRAAVQRAGGEVGIALIIGLAAYIGSVFVYGRGGPADTVGGGTTVVSRDLSEYYELVTGTVTFSPTDPVLGSPSARYTLVEWADYQCPHCAWMAEELKKLLADPANGDVRLVYKNYPISNVCNPQVEHNGHPNACNAAAAGECAREVGRFWELSGAMFKNQDYLGKDDIRFMAEQNGIDPQMLDECMARPQTAEAVFQDVDAGVKAGVEGTPSIYLLGAFGDQWVRLNGDAEQISAVLAAARRGDQLPPPRPHEHDH